MKLVVVSSIEFENWEISYLKYLDYTTQSINRFRDCTVEIDPNIFNSKEALIFKAGYVAAEEDCSEDW